jgi:hypothetical protein
MTNNDHGPLVVIAAQIVVRSSFERAYLDTWHARAGRIF